MYCEKYPYIVYFSPERELKQHEIQMMKHELTKTNRVNVVDALRGFALMAIMLLHNIEHFNFYRFPDDMPPLIKAFDGMIWDTLFFLFGGKSYAIFALLFGFSFFVQFNSRKLKGEDFTLRFAWRLVLLFGFGMLNAAFFPGDILTLYAIVGFVLIPIRNMSNKWLIVIAAMLMLQPYEIYKMMNGWLNPDYSLPSSKMGFYWSAAMDAVPQASLWELICSNVWNGELFTLIWAWDNGRFFQTASLFLFGFLLARNKKFVSTDENIRFWGNVLAWSLVAFFILFNWKSQFNGSKLPTAILTPARLIVGSWNNFAFMSVLVSGFYLLWHKVKCQKWFARLIPYGRMSLTNYIGQGVIGSFVYFGYGLALYQYLGSTYSFLLGIGLFIAQLWCSVWWLEHFKQGPLEWIWKQLTWIGKRNQS